MAPDPSTSLTRIHSVKGADLPSGPLHIPDPQHIDPKLKLLGVQSKSPLFHCGNLYCGNLPDFIPDFIPDLIPDPIPSLTLPSSLSSIPPLHSSPT